MLLISSIAIYMCVCVRACVHRVFSAGFVFCVSYMAVVHCYCRRRYCYCHRRSC